MSQTPLQDPPEPAAHRPGRPADSAWARWRPLLVRLHFYAGLFAGPFILVAAVTGLLYALIAQLDTAVYRHELTVDRVGEHRMALSAQLAAARAAHPEGTVASIRPPAAPDETTQVNLTGPGLPDDVPPDYGRTVFVDPYTGEIRGALTTYGQWMPLRAWFDELHRTLHLGAFGRNYSELAASWLWVVALGGLVLWAGQRRSGGPGTRRWRRLVVPDRPASGRRRLLGWHGAVGVWIIPVLLALSVSGMTWSRFAGQSIDALQSRLDWHAPAVDTVLSGPTVGTDPLRGADQAWHAAQQQQLTTPIRMYPPSGPGQGWQVAENKRDWPTRYDAISVDPDTGTVTDRVNFADWPLGAKLTDWIIGAHMGILFGVLNQVVLAAVAIGLITVVALGYRMWWRRRPTRAGFALPVGRRRGALSALRPHEAVIAVVALSAIGWFAPLFGLSLVAFVAVDVALGWRRSRSGAAS